MEYKGLTEAQAQENLAKFGPNKFPEEVPPSDFKILLLQLKSPLVYILLFASLVTIFLRDFTDTAVILAAVFINTILGFYQERKAERAVLSLKKILTPHAKVIREGKLKIIEADLLVPGDLVVLGQGDKVAADGIVVEAVNLTINEAILTGESMPVKKLKARFSTPKPRGRKLATSVASISKLKTDESQIFMGTTVSSGRGKVLIIKTGKETEIGKIAIKLKTLEEEETPLQRRIATLARVLAILVGVICGLIFLAGIFVGKSTLEMFTTSVAIAVASIPEGMVVSLTVILAIGMQRILKRKALVRKLLAAETLGSVSVIATDKTGTLTEGKLKIVKTRFIDKNLAYLASILVNNLADPLEVALWEWAKKEGSRIEDPQKIVDQNPRVFEMPFDPEKKYQMVVVKTGGESSGIHFFYSALSFGKEKSGHSVEGRGEATAVPKGPHYKNDPFGFSETAKELLVAFVSGAPEVVLSKCKFPDKEKKAKWLKEIEKWGKEGLRMIGLGYKQVEQGDSKALPGTLENEVQDLNWLGLVGFEDPVREGVAQALEVCGEAGIKVKIVSGDYPETAIAVWQKLNERKDPPRFLNGSEIEKMPLEKLKTRLKEIDIFARVTPSQKLKIVEALKENGEVVALIGDGVNDAPALKRSDIGIVVGEATDVAKETADMVLIDSNFGTIVAAIEEGRGIFENIKKVILYLLSDSFSEVFLVLGCLGLGLPLPLTATQILYINLLTDGFPNLALTVEPKEEGLLKRKPIKKDAPLISPAGKLLIGLISIFTSLACLLIFTLFFKRASLVLARTITFVALGIDSLFYIFSVKSLNKPILKINFFSNPYLLLAVAAGLTLQILPLYHPFLRSFLNIVPLNLGQWLLVLTTSLVVIILIEGVKFFFLKKKWLDR